MMKTLNSIFEAIIIVLLTVIIVLPEIVYMSILRWKDKYE
jgi:hypothetical protein